MPSIDIPNDWRPRKYQMPLWLYLEGGGKRACAIWHRRAGKDSLAMNWTARAAFQRVGTYWHMLPTLKQARRVVWNGIDGKGRRMIDQAFPLAVRNGEALNNDMLIRLMNGSIWQCVGSDNYDALVGSNVLGIVGSEWALADPAAWDKLRPILRENGGWALFITTPRGRNHAHEMFEAWKTLDHCFTELIAPYDKWAPLRHPEGMKFSGALSEEDIAEERAEGMDDDEIDQEYFVSFDAALKGSYYGKAINLLQQKGNIKREHIFDPVLDVQSAWDLGMDDSTAIWLFQVFGKEIRLIDYYESAGAGLDHYVRVLRGQEPGWERMADYTYGKHWLPHDASVKELGTGVSRLETLRSLGLRGTVTRKLGIQDGIQGVRNILPRCWFDEERCHKGLAALRNYQREWDEERQVFLQKARHDWSSHGADAFRTLAVANPKASSKRDDPIDYEALGMNKGIV